MSIFSSRILTKAVETTLVHITYDFLNQVRMVACGPTLSFFSDITQENITSWQW